MHPNSNVASVANPFASSSSVHNPNAFNQPGAVVVNALGQPTVNMLPAPSYPSLAMASNPVTNAVFAPSVMPPQQHNQTPQQQPVVFSGNSGGFFLAQPNAVGGTPVMLAPGQSNNPFVVAQSVPSPANSIPPGPSQPHTNCIIRLPDGRYVMPTQAPSPMSLHASTIPRVAHGVPPTYFNLSMAAGSVPTNTTPQLAQQPQPGASVLGANPGQAFYIQVPSTSSFNNTMFTTSCSASTIPLQAHHNTILKPMMQCAGSSAPTSRTVMSSSLPMVQSSIATPFSRGPSLVTSSNLPYMSAIPCRTPNSLISSSTCDTQSVDSMGIQRPFNPCAAAGLATIDSISTTISGDMAMTRLNNDIYTTAATCWPQSSVVASTVNSTPSQGTVKVSASNSRKNNASRSSYRQGNPASMLQRLEEQINMLGAISNPTEAQKTQLKQLTEVRQQLSRTSKPEMANPKNGSSASSPSTTPVVRPIGMQMSPALRSEILDLLTKHNLLPKINSPTAETFVVEFRLNQQRYQLRLTRPQKSDMERLLFSQNPQRQAEILTVLQQEQSRHNAFRPRSSVGKPAQSPIIAPSGAVAPTVSPFASAPTSIHPTRLQQPIPPYSPFSPHPMTPAAFCNPSTGGLRLLTTRPVMPTTGLLSNVRNAVPVTMAPTAPVMGVVHALAMPSLTTPCSNTQLFTPGVGSTLPHGMSIANAPSGGLFLSSSVPTGTQTFVMQPQPPVMFPSSSVGATLLPVSYAHSTPQTQPTALETTPLLTQPLQLCVTPNLTPPIPSVSTTSKQSFRLGRMRALLMNDVKWMTDKPIPSGQCSQWDRNLDSKTTALQLLEVLSAYHIYQDADNTEESLDKVDEILHDSTSLLLARKRRIIEAVQSQIYGDSSFLLESRLQDRLLVSKMAIDLERDVLEGEKTAFTESMDQLKNMPSSLDTISPCLPFTLPKDSPAVLPEPWTNLLGPLSRLRPLQFDDLGNGTIKPIILPSWPEAQSAMTNHTNGSAKCLGSNGRSVNHEFPIISNEKSTIEKSQPAGSVSDSTGDDENIGVQDDSAGDSEADLFLGLGTRQSRMENSPDTVHVNGFVDEEDQITPISARQMRRGSTAFDEAYDLWQELMREEGMDMDDIGSESLDTSNLANTAVRDADKSPKKSNQFLGNGSTEIVSDVQHSEDPDIDAAIRSILSTSN